MKRFYKEKNMQELSPKEIQTVLENARDGVLGFAQNGVPYCIPFGFVYIDGVVYLSMFPRGRKWHCYQESRKVCFNVFLWTDDRSRWSSVVIDGELEMVNDINKIESVVKANLIKTGMDADRYLASRMQYYRKALDNPEALKIFKINAIQTGGKTMHSMAGKQPKETPTP